MDTPPPPDAPPRGANKPFLIGLALTALTLAVYGPSLGGEYEFHGIDDPDYVTANPHVLRGLTAGGVKWAFTSYQAFNWHPLTWLSLQLNASLFGTSAASFRGVNVALHLANTLLLFGLLHRLTGAVWRAAAVAAVFAVHPTHVESVAWVSERKDVLSTLFWLLTTIAYVRYAERPGVGRYLLVVLTFAVGLMAKPMLVTLPATLLLLDYWPLRRWPGGGGGRYAPAGVGRLVAEKLPLFALVAASIPLTLQAQAGLTKNFDQIPPLLRLGNALVAYVQYVGMTAWPTNLAIFYPHPGETLPTGRTVLAAVFVAAVSAVVVWQAKRRPYLFVGWFWFLGTLVPVIGLVQVGNQALADRYTYVPSIGLLVAVVWGLADLAAGRPGRELLLAWLVVLFVAGYAVLAGYQVRHWRTDETLWRQAAEVTDENAIAHDYLGMALFKKGQLDDAEKHLKESIRIQPRYAATHVNLGLVLSARGKLDEAAKRFDAAIRMQPDLAMPHLALGRVRMQQGQLADARKHLEDALARDPASADARLMLGELLEDGGEFDAARTHYEAVLAMSGHAADAHNHLGRLLNRQGNPTAALEQYDAALKLDPKSGDAHNNKGVALEALGRMPEAVKSYRAAVALDPNQGVYRRNLAYALYESGEQAEARELYEKSARADPDWPPQAMEAAWNLATHPDAKRRNGTQAVRLAKQVCHLTGFRMAQALDVLAAGYAEQGKFDDAVYRAKAAVELLPPNIPADIAQGVKDRVKLYEDKKPYREPPK